MELLNSLIDRKLSYKPLYCTASSNCWCMKLHTKLESQPGYDVCMTPKQILDNYKLPEIDYNYLKSLLNRECLW